MPRTGDGAPHPFQHEAHMDVDVETHGHHHKTGHSIIDLAVALCALVVSVVSVVIAIHHGQTMEKLVAASSWPSVQIATSNADDQGHPDLRLLVMNVGVGPARIGKFVVRYQGQPVRNARELLERCCDTADLPPEQRPTLTTSAVLGRVIPARETVNYLRYRHSEASAATWQRLDAARADIAAEVCYCSVFDECWIGDSSSAAPRRTESCETLAGPNYEDGNIPATASGAAP